MDLPDREACSRALQSRDARFDGLIFVGLSSTGVYCRSVCPAKTPKFRHCQFFPSAAAAQDAGFRLWRGYGAQHLWSADGDDAPAAAEPELPHRIRR
jgi:Metal binding domain of Ada